MLYAGQEFGERGMDVEGFSRLDGRTSIYDYWSVDTLRRFKNSGQYDLKLLCGQFANVFGSLLAVLPEFAQQLKWWAVFPNYSKLIFKLICSEIFLLAYRC
jgi:hypothetical protein